MAEVVTISEERIGGIHKVALAVVSDTDGTADATTTYAYSGEVVRFVAAPDGGGTQPTDNFDMVLNDEDGYDILAGNGANLSNAAATTVATGLGAIANDKIAISASNMGSAKGATFYVYIRP